MRGQKGFTLAELIVVVAIVIGLAAIILPNIGLFAGRGEEGNLAVERNSVQTALDTYLTEPGNWPLDEGQFNHPDGVPEADFGTGGTLNLAEVAEPYLRLPGAEKHTKAHYCWDAFGTVQWAGTEFAETDTCGGLAE